MTWSRLNNRLVRLVATGLLLGGLTWTAGLLMEDPAQARPVRLDWSVLELSPSQKQVFVEAEKDWRQTFETLQPELMRANGQLRYLMAQPTPNEPEIRQVQRRVNELEAQLRDKATETFLKKKRALTPTQRARLMDMIRQYPNGDGPSQTADKR